MDAGLVSLVLIAGVYGDGTSQPGAQPGPGEIVVTGERVPRTFVQTPSSVTVLTGDRIEAAASDRLEDLIAFVPNVQIGSGSEGPTIRGQDSTGALRDLPAFLGGTRPRVTLIVDGRPVGYNEFIFGVAPLWDIARVEIFRTPQTTTQGRNSIAGAIFVHSREPEFDWSGKARAIVGDLVTRQVSAAVTGPLIADQAALRLSVDHRSARPASEITSLARGADATSDRYTQVRGRLRLEPASLGGTRIDLILAHLDSLAPQIEGVRRPFKERRDPGAAYGIFRSRSDSLTARISHSASSSLQLEASGSAGDGRFRRYAPPGLGESKIRLHDRSLEIVARWNPSRSLRWLAGLSLIDNDLKQAIDLSVLAGRGEFDDDQASFGLFGEIAVQPLPRVTIDAGLRYQRDRQRRVGRLASVSLDYDESFSAWLPKLSVAYALSENARVGAFVQRAFNPGGTSIRLDTGQPDLFDAERLWNYEAFGRARLAPGLDAGFNLFHAAMEDGQRALPIVIVAPSGSLVTFADLLNVPRSRSRGFEGSLRWRPSSRLRIEAAIGLLGTRIVEGGPDYPMLTGNDFQRSPRFSASASIDWTPTDRFRLSFQSSHNSGYFSDDLENASRRIDGRTRIDGRAEWNFRKVSLFAYGRNLLDDFHMTYLFRPDFGTAGKPRELGIGIQALY